jgi:hypothetical protein
MTTITQEIAASEINERHELRKRRRRARYHGRQDRPKVFPADSEGLSVTWRKEEIDRDNAALATLKVTQDAAEYVRAWCILNRLVP